MEVLSLNLIPTGTTPVVHVKQYDVGRTWRFELKEGPIVYTLDGSETIECDIKKKDGNVVTVAVTNTSASYIDIETTLQMTACSGDNLGAIRLTKGSDDIGTLNFILACERSPLENGIESESSIHNLNTMVDEMVAEDVAEQYDSGNVIFDNEPTENHGTGYTVTSEGIKTAIDNAFDYDNTASGSLVHIEDGADNIPVKSLVSQIVAVESGSGEKSPTNPYTISGFDSGIITRCGKNLFDYTQITSASGWTVSGGVYSGTIGNLYLYARNGFPIQPKWVTNQRYVLKLKVNNTDGNSRFRFMYTDNTYSDLVITSANVGNYISIVTEINKTISNLFFSYNVGGNLSISEICLEVGDTATTYEAYNGTTYTFTFGQTIFGGHFDNKGNLVVTHGTKTFTGASSESWSEYPSYNGFYIAITDMNIGTRQDGLANRFVTTFDSSHTSNSCWFGVNSNRLFILECSGTTGATVADLKTWLANNNLTVVYPLATPITLSITSQDIPTLLGENNIFSNCGDLEVEYYTSKSNDILEFIESEIGKKNGTNIPIEENSQDSIKDYVDDEVSTINTSLSNKASKTEDTTITLASGYSLISSSCGKTDRLVHLNFNVEKTGGFATGWQAIGTTEFKPNTLVYCPLWNVTNGVGNGEVRIDTDGTINFYIVTAGELRLNVNIGYVTS